jgi:D-serine deaminase-like pyridoxal phosphate-dependent protein
MNREFCIAGPERYVVRDLDEVETPRLLLFDWALRANRERLKAASDGFRNVRLMAKTVKASAVFEEYRRDGLTAIKASCVGEARAVVEGTGIKDVLVAFPLYGPAVRSFLALRAENPDRRIAAMVSNRACAEALSDGATDEVEVFLDVDPGMLRTGVAFGPRVGELADVIHSLPRLRLVGLHVYDGQIRHPNAVAVRRYSDALMARIDGIVSALGGPGVIGEAVTSSSITALSNLEAHAAGGYAWHHTVSPGTTVLWDSNYNDLMPGAFEYAAAVAARVVDARPYRDGWILTTDCGHKMGASTDHGVVHVLSVSGFRVFGVNERFGRLLWLGHDRATGAPLDADPTELLGHVVLIFPNHVCPTVNQYSFALRVRDGAIAERVPIDGRDG